MPYTWTFCDDYFIVITMVSNEDTTPCWLIGRQSITTQNSDGSRPLTVAEAKKLLSSYKGQVTRNITSSEKAITFAETLPSD